MSLLDLEQIEVNVFRGRSVPGWRGVFGGQVIGQALVAAERTVESRVAHSLHGYFLLPGDGAAPILYQVERTRDGRTFATRRVQAVQHGQIIFSMIASFQLPESGFEHSTQMPDVPPPEELPSTGELRDRWVAEGGPLPPWATMSLRGIPGVEVRPVAPEHPVRPVSRDPRQALWFRAADRLADDPRLHRCLLACASDYALLPTALRAHGKGWGRDHLFIASVDHALWFHRPARVDEWLLYTMESPTAQGARGLVRGLVFDRAGGLVASVAQEGLIRDLSRTSDATP
jgi:acyl-CoA thioesterase-2